MLARTVTHVLVGLEARRVEVEAEVADYDGAGEARVVLRKRLL